LFSVILLCSMFRLLFIGSDKDSLEALSATVLKL